MKAAKKVNKEKIKLDAANVDSNLFCKLFIASAARKGDIPQFFMHENNQYPPSLSENGSLRKSAVNDDLINCLYKNKKTDQPSRSKCDTPETATAFVMNAIAHVQASPPTSVMTVKDYSEHIFSKIIDAKRDQYVRVDVLFDVNENSLEEMTKEMCNEENYISLIDNDTKMQKGTVWFTKFLSKIKTKNQFLKKLSSNYVANSHIGNGNVLGFDDHIIIACNETTDTNFCLPIENLNSRMLLHVEDAVQNGHQHIFLSTTDHHMVFVALYAFKYLKPKLEKLWIELLDAKETRIFSIHQLYELHEDKTDVLPFFSALTGSHTTSNFFGIGKTTAWNAWMKFPDIASAMLQLLNDGTPTLDDEAMAVVEEFIVKMYDSSSKMTKLHDCRRDLFTRKNKPRPIDRIPPTRDALEQHVKRSLLQSIVWAQCLRSKIKSLDPIDWGWRKDESTNRYVPFWISIPIVADHCTELIACKCPKQCTGRCRCVKNRLPCTMLCACDGMRRKDPQ